MKQKKKKKQRRKNYYFTQLHEDAIVKYANTEDLRIRTELYVEYIQPAFDQMVDKIIFTYRFTNLPNIDYLKDDCKIWLTTILNKYDPSKGSKAFSYFSVVTKNWFIHKVKKRNMRAKKEIHFEDMINELENKCISDEETYISKREDREFWLRFQEEVKHWDTGNLKPNEKKVLEAVKILFESSDDIEIFNKKAIYLYLRELTGLNTKQVVNNLNKIRIKYRNFKSKWDDGEI